MSRFVIPADAASHLVIPADAGIHPESDGFPLSRE
jgi:hypothetical protein